jgi:hypothetical protein
MGLSRAEGAEGNKKAAAGVWSGHSSRQRGIHEYTADCPVWKPVALVCVAAGEEWGRLTRGMVAPAVIRSLPVAVPFPFRAPTGQVLGPGCR